MRPLKRTTAIRMCEALDCALEDVRTERSHGLCFSLIFSTLSRYEYVYLTNWIRNMLGRSNIYLEQWQLQSRSIDIMLKTTAWERYNNRKPWVEWMKRHLMETSI